MSAAVFYVGSVADKLRQLHPENNDRYRRSELGAGRLFADCFEDCARFSLGERAWRVYDGKHWTVDAGGARTAELCKSLADGLLRYAASVSDLTLQEPFAKFAAGWQKRHFRDVVLADAASVHPIEPNAFDRDDWVLNVKNGELDLRTLELHPHRPESLLSKLADVDYIPDAECPRWDSFVDEITCGDTDLAAYLQRCFGLSLTGDISNETFFILHGPTSRNGKTTLCETVRSLLGDYACSAQPDTFAERKFTNGGAPSEDLARLAGRRFITLPEPDNTLTISASRLKAFTGGDCLTARRPYESSTEFIPRGKLFFNCNEAPRCSDPAVFNSGRAVVIPFDRHFAPDQQDPNLKALFRQSDNLSAVLNWSLAGLKDYVEHGLKNPPEAVRAATEEYAGREGYAIPPAADSVGRFLADETEENFAAEVTSGELYDAYKVWAEQNYSNAVTIQRFGRALKEKGLSVTRKHPAAGSEKCTVILGRRLRQRP